MFEHSVKAPRLYKTAAGIAKKVKEDGASVKGLVYEKKHPNIKAIYALVVETLQRSGQIDFLMKKSQILVKEPRLDQWLARVLIMELLWGKKRLPGESKPVKTILAYEQILKAHFTDIHECDKTLKVQKPRFVRVNTLKLSLNEAVEGFRDEGWTFSQYTDTDNYRGFLERVSNMNEEEFIGDLHVDNLLVFPNNTQFYKHQAYLDGSIILQDKASCLPVQVLNPPPGSKVLDMCAAPGMKTTQLAAHLNNTGTVFAVEMDQKRIGTLNKMVESAGATCVKTLNRDVVTITSKDIPGIEYILVDPTCSGSGIIDRVEIEDDSAKLDKRLSKLAGFQIKILKHALRNFPDSKRVVYSTCSIYPQENEDVIAEVIASCTQFKLINVKSLLKAPWANFASNDPESVGGHCIYAKPEDDLTNGFFIAVFERLSEGEQNIFLKETLSKRIREEENENDKDNRRKHKSNDGASTADDITDLVDEVEGKKDYGEPSTDESKKSKKCKRKCKDENITIPIDDSNELVKKHQNGELVENGTTAKTSSKKKKKSTTNGAIDKTEDDNLNIGEDVKDSNKKKKNKKHKSIESSTSDVIDMSVNAEDSNKKKKKDKSKKNKSVNCLQENRSDEDRSKTIIGPVISQDCSPKKKEKNKSINGIEVIPDSSSTKKKKRSILPTQPTDPDCSEHVELNAGKKTKRHELNAAAESISNNLYGEKKKKKKKSKSD